MVIGGLFYTEPNNTNKNNDIGFSLSEETVAFFTPNIRREPRRGRISKRYGRFWGPTGACGPFYTG